MSIVIASVHDKDEGREEANHEENECLRNNSTATTSKSINNNKNDEDKNENENKANTRVKPATSLPTAQPSSGSRSRSRSTKLGAETLFNETAYGMTYTLAQGAQIRQLGLSHARQAQQQAMKLAVYHGHVHDLAARLAFARLHDPADDTAADGPELAGWADRQAALRLEIDRAVAGLDVCLAVVRPMLPGQAEEPGALASWCRAQAGYLGLVAKLFRSDYSGAQTELSKMENMVKHVPELKDMIAEGIEAYASRRKICSVEQRK